MFIKNTIFLSIVIHAGLSAAASDGMLPSIIDAGLAAAAPNCMLPFTGEQTQPYAQNDEFFIQLRSNNTAYVADHLSKQMALRYGGKTTWFHVLVALERFHGLNPRGIIDAFAEKTKDACYAINLNGNIIYRTGIESLCHLKANVNHPDFYYLCTGTKRKGHTPVKLYLTPLEIAMRHRSIKTLCSIDAHIDGTRHYMRELFNNPELQHDLDLAERIVSGNRRRRRESSSIDIPLKFAETIIKNFGTQGMLLMNRYSVDLFSVEYDPAFPTAPTPFDLFKKHHPDKIHEITHLIPVPPKPLLIQFKEWWHNTLAAPESENQYSESSSEEDENCSNGDSKLEVSDDSALEV